MARVVARPGARRVRSPAQAAPGISVPFDFVDSRVVVHLKLDGKGPYAFVLDSGAGFTIAPQVVAALGLTSNDAFSIGGDGPALGPRKPRPDRYADARPDHDARSDLYRFGHGRHPQGERAPAFDGLIGSELFSRYVVRIDYRTHVLTLTDPAQYAYRGAGTIVPIAFAGGIPRVDAAVDGIAGSFTIDTGDRMDVTFMEPVIAREHLLEQYSPRIETITGWGIGGAVPGFVARAHELRMGALDVKDPLLRLPTVKGGFFTSRRLTGSIGTGVTDRFTLTFDYSRKRLIFENPASGERNSYDRSGLWLNQAPDGFDVAAVAPQSPAAAAGISAGDRVVAVNGIPAREIPLADVRTWLRADPGTRVTVTLDRAGARTDVPLTLQDLV